MNEEKILDAIGEIDDDIIEEADHCRNQPTGKAFPRTRIIAAAACAVLVLGLTFVTADFIRNNPFITSEKDAAPGLKVDDGEGGLQSPSAEEAGNDNETPEMLAENNAETSPASSDVTADGVIPETSAPVTESFAASPKVTVTVQYDQKILTDCAVPTITVEGNAAASDRINESEAIAKAVEDASSAEGASTGVIPYIKASPASLTIGYSVYNYNGGTHPIHYTKYFNFSLESGDRLGITDVLDKSNSNAERMLELAVTAALHEAQSKYTDGTVFDRSFEEIATELISGKADDKWYLTEDALRITYSPYDIAHYAAGYIQLEIPYDDIPGVIDKRYVPVSDTDGTVRVAETYSTSPFLVANGAVSHLTVRAGVYEWDTQPIVYYASRVENNERINLGSYQNYHILYNSADSFEYVPYENVPGNIKTQED